MKGPKPPGPFTSVSSQSCLPPLSLPLGPPWRGRKELGFQVQVRRLPNSVYFGGGFVFGLAIINSCSAAQTTLQVSRHCLPSAPLQVFTGTGRLCCLHRACESQCRMQPQLPGHVIGLVCSVTGTKEGQIHAAAVTGQTTVPFAVIKHFPS